MKAILVNDDKTLRWDNVPDPILKNDECPVGIHRFSFCHLFFSPVFFIRETLCHFFGHMQSAMAKGQKGRRSKTQP